jgi:aminoglycoside 6'-N-acetyltransferase
MALILETQRLRIRPFQESDLQPFAAYRSDPLVAHYQQWETPYTLEQATQFIQAMKNSPPQAKELINDEPH